MAAVSANCTPIQLKNMHASSTNSCSPREMQHHQQHHHQQQQPQRDANSIRKPVQNEPQPSTTGSTPTVTTISQRGSIDHSTMFRKPTSPPHQQSCSSDSDATTTTTTSSPSATAMRRLYFKTAKLSRNTQNSITALHQQAQHVPKVKQSDNLTMLFATANSGDFFL